MHSDGVYFAGQGRYGRDPKRGLENQKIPKGCCFGRGGPHRIVDCPKKGRLANFIASRMKADRHGRIGDRAQKTLYELCDQLPDQDNSVSGGSDDSSSPEAPKGLLEVERKTEDKQCGDDPAEAECEEEQTD